MIEQSASGHRTPKGRSPSYPGISLGVAIDRARTLYDKERNHPAPMATITGHWGYKSPTTGPASVTYAALKKFGLLEEERDGSTRKGRLTPLAVEILMKPDSAEAIKKAALSPGIHRELWDLYGDQLPSEDNLRYQLVAERGFTESGFNDFIREYKETISFAHLSTPVDNDPDSDADERASDGASPAMANDEAKRDQSTPHYGSSGPTMSIPIPLVGSNVVTISGSFPVSEIAWTQLLAVLGAMKPGLVTPEHDDRLGVQEGRA